MKKLLGLCIFFVFNNSLIYAQTETCNCKNDLDFLITKMQKMPSYKKQVKGDKQVKFQNTYNALSKKMNNPVSIKDCYKMLQEQMMVVNDLHSNIYFDTEYFSKADYKDEEKLEDFINSNNFKNHPKTTKDLSVLKSKLKKKPKDDIEGIYNFGEKVTIGIYKTKEKEYDAVVLTSNSKIWEPGQIKFSAKRNEFGKYDVLAYDDFTRKLMMVKSLTYENGRLWKYKNTGNSNNFEIETNTKTSWDFKQLNDNTQYVYFGNFSTFSSKNKKAFKDFYEANKNNFKSAKHIIIDLRNNSGGNKKLSDPFLKLFKNSKAKLYILTNSFTASNGEQFTVKLKKIKGLTHLGQTTYGIISYGLNYGNSYKTPSNYFSILPTDMNFHEYYEYEGYGVTPDIKLDFNSDWIEQTLNIIKSNN